MNDQPIEALNFVESVRKRPGMFIGSVGIKGFSELLKQVFEALQEYVPGASVFEMGFYPGNRVVLELRDQLEEKLSTHIATWDKYDPVYDIDWIKALVALSSDTYIQAGDLELSSKHGHFTTSVATPSGNAEVIIDFTIDPEIFKDYQLVYDQVNPFLQQFAYLNPDLKIVSEDHSGAEYQRNVFHYPKGIFQQLDFSLSQIDYWSPSNFRLNIEGSLNGYYYRIGLHTPNPWSKSTRNRTFAGNIETYWGGSLENGIMKGLLLTLKTLAKQKHVGIHANKKAIRACFAFMAAVAGKEFEYEGSTKRKLGGILIQKDVSMIVHEHLIEYYRLNPEKTDALLQKFCIQDEARNPC